jgi:hypothetical protein
MKPLIIVILTLIFLTAFRQQRIPRNGSSLTCRLKCDKTKYKVGEVPKFKVEIVNNSGKDIYLIGALDGSDVKWRMPHCYYTIQKPGPDTIHFERCGNMNSLKPQDFRFVKAGSKFNPYENIGDYGFFTDFTTTNSETFKSRGIYKIQFHYSTNSQNIKDFMGDRPLQQDRVTMQKLVSLLKQVPRVDIVSNEIEITIGD